MTDAKDVVLTEQALIEELGFRNKQAVARARAKGMPYTRISTQHRVYRWHRVLAWLDLHERQDSQGGSEVSS